MTILQLKILNRTLYLAYLGLFLSSCELHEKIDTHEYYFPLEEFKKDKTYFYLVTTNYNKLDTIFWNFTRSGHGNKRRLISKSFTPKGIISHNIETFTDNASIYSSSTLFQNDNQNLLRINARISENANIVFPFKLSKREEFHLKIEYTNPIDNSFVSIERIRKYHNTSKINYSGQTLDCITFLGNELLLIQNKKIVFKTEECFAKGIGLVRSKKIGQGINIETTLVDIQ